MCVGSNPASGTNFKIEIMDYLWIIQEEFDNKDISIEAMKMIAHLCKSAEYSKTQVIIFCEELGNYLGDNE
ncbi:hypothetical protein DK095_460171 [Flavobacterium psychrophilum]|uniref:hypothetical protein n=2 Tax=Flavobacterium psychrophilum TaxID=96345 RepID=UPI000B7C1D20|nr:hypothetical protein [Flavobacterium psychrophilum]SNA72091.1 hypothetical protein FI070_170028 [Flavobacterium psychrophilum]SNA77669.1 hypothetical protein DK095_460171 [Flavobacterium psychrophilum]